MENEKYSVRISLPLELHILLEEMALQRKETITDALKYIIIEQYDTMVTDIRTQNISHGGD